jgi:F0F1-type ATP synthase alpha subunit
MVSIRRRKPLAQTLKHSPFSRVKVTQTSLGVVASIGDGIARVRGLAGVKQVS